MHAALLLLALLASPQAPAATEAPPRLRLASYNVENLFDNHDDPYRSDEGTSPKPIPAVRLLARTIDGLGADVLAVQEVENRGVLELLNLQLAEPYPFVELVEGNDGRGIDVGLLSRFPIRRTISHRLRSLDGGRRFARDLVVFELDTGAGPLLVAPVHLKSKRDAQGDPQGTAWRTAEARAALAVLRELRERGLGGPFALLGDFNDEKGSAALAPLFDALRDGLASVPEGRAWSYEYQGRKQRIDHLLLDGFDGEVRADFVHAEDRASDHAPFFADLAWGQGLRREPGPARRPRLLEPHRPRVEATDTVRLRGLLLHEVEVEGTLAEATETRTGGHLQLRFAKDARDALTLFLPAHRRAAFDHPERLAGKRVRARGAVFLYRGRLEVELFAPEQLEPLDG
ncbi:MAG: endonuclease/exonuclease/phosphatase family protein [Planctomycetota bacterium]